MTQNSKRFKLRFAVFFYKALSPVFTGPPEFAIQKGDIVQAPVLPQGVQ